VEAVVLLTKTIVATTAAKYPQSCFCHQCLQSNLHICEFDLSLLSTACGITPKDGLRSDLLSVDKREKDGHRLLGVSSLQLSVAYIQLVDLD